MIQTFVTLLSVLALAASGIVASAEPVKLIFDTDMHTDCDDTGAMAVLHALADNGEVQILATVTSSRNQWAVETISAINTYYGRPEIPVGAPRGVKGTGKSSFTRKIAEQFPHAIRNPADIPDAMDVYGRILQDAADDSIVIITVGYMTNIADLLRMPAQAGRPGGMDLVRKKVRLWACMGGNFVGVPPKDDLKLGNVNFTVDAPAAHFAITHWPGRLTFVGREIGSIPSGLKAGARLAETPETNPVRMAYRLYHKGKSESRHVADPTTVLFAVRGLRDYWDIHTTGKMDLQRDMTFTWQEGPAGNQSYLLKKRIDGKPNDRYIEETIESLMIQPPRKKQ